MMHSRVACVFFLLAGVLCAQQEIGRFQFKVEQIPMRDGKTLAPRDKRDTRYFLTADQTLTGTSPKGAAEALAIHGGIAEYCDHVPEGTSRACHRFVL
jgi:hypothetical protein